MWRQKQIAIYNRIFKMFIWIRTKQAPLIITPQGWISYKQKAINKRCRITS